MHLQRIKIGNFKNLVNVEISFSEVFQSAHEGPSNKPIRSHAVIGQNGTGKSNLIEALITIFRDLDLDRDAGFDYELEYSIRGHAVRLQAVVSQQRPFVWVDGKTESQGYLLGNRELLPSHVFAYYSGRNERIERRCFRSINAASIAVRRLLAEEVLPEHLLRNFTASESDIRAIEAVRKTRGKQDLEAIWRRSPAPPVLLPGRPQPVGVVGLFAVGRSGI